MKYDFKAFGQAIKEARKAKVISRNQLVDKLNIAPHYIASIENSGQHTSLQIFYELNTFLDVSVDQLFFPNEETDKSTQRRQLESLLADMSSRNLTIMTATARFFRRQPSEVSKNQRMIFLALKTEDGRITGKIAFYCRMLGVSRQGFYKYLANRNRPWKYQDLADAMKSDNLLKREFHPDAPLKKCVTDITEIKASDGKLYVSAIFDCFDLGVLGLAMETNMNSAGGRCHDNARCESMWARIKTELLYDRYDTEHMTVEELKILIWRYFLSYWNNRRICSANGGLPPMPKRRRYYEALKLTA